MIYVTGDNRQGQLGVEVPPPPATEKIGERDMSNSPLPLDLVLDKQVSIRKLAFGAFSSLLTFSGEIFVWGVADLKHPTFL